MAGIRPIKNVLCFNMGAHLMYSVAIAKFAERVIRLLFVKINKLLWKSTSHIFFANSLQKNWLNCLDPYIFYPSDLRLLDRSCWKWFNARPLHYYIVHYRKRSFCLNVYLHVMNGFHMEQTNFQFSYVAASKHYIDGI